MRRSPKFAAFLWLCVFASTGLLASESAVAQERCALFGPIAMSGHTGVLLGIATGDRKKLVEATEDGLSLLRYYRELGCPMQPLYNAMECVVHAARDPQNRGKTYPKITEECMRSSGMAVK